MAACLRVLAGVALSAALLAGGAPLLPPRLLADLGLDWGDLSDLPRRHAEQRARADDLRRRDGAALERGRARREVAHRLLAGELTLFEAAARFKRLNDTPDGPAVDYRRNFPAPSDGESLCRWVLHYAETELLDAGVTDPGPLESLRGQLEERLVRDGTVELPQD